MPTPSPVANTVIQRNAALVGSQSTKQQRPNRSQRKGEPRNRRQKSRNAEFDPTQPDRADQSGKFLDRIVTSSIFSSQTPWNERFRLFLTRQQIAFYRSMAVDGWLVAAYAATCRPVCENCFQPVGWNGIGIHRPRESLTLNVWKQVLIVGILLSVWFTMASTIQAALAVDFVPVPGFLKLPEGWRLGSCSAVAINRQGEIFLFHRGKHPILGFAADGRYLRSWGDDLIDSAHGLRIDRDDHIWVTDIGCHRVFKFDSGGKLLLALGTGKPGDGTDQFNKPTDVAFGTGGEFYVSDGYGNNRVLKFSPGGGYIKSWGKRGNQPGEFHLPHSIIMDRQGRLLVGDRENNRIQIFDSEGKLLDIWNGFAPYGLGLDNSSNLFVADGRANTVLRLDEAGKIQQTWGRKGTAPASSKCRIALPLTRAEICWSPKSMECACKSLCASRRDSVCIIKGRNSVLKIKSPLPDHTMKTKIFRLVLVTVIALESLVAARTAEAGSADDFPIKIATFDLDATPPLGSPMAYDPVKRIDELGLRCRGIVLTGAGKPIVLCAVDWIGIANEGHDAFRDALAEAAGTTRDRVAVHTLHQHDAPGCDFTAERIIRELGVADYGRFEGTFHRQVIRRAADAIRSALPAAQSVTHYGLGVAAVKEVASNRRIQGPDGRVRATRYTATRDAALRAEPEGVIDPQVSLISFWNGERPIAVLSYYACHPQSYYRTGIPSPDFPGIARFVRGQAVPEALHVHFNGAGGNIGAGKYNDGAKENRMVLALRVAEGMRQAWVATQKHSLTTADVGWQTVPVRLPVAPHLKAADLIQALRAEPARGHIAKADQLAWLKYCESGHAIDIACLRLGSARVLHMPGELFVEYQLAAKALRPDLFVAMAAYGNYGPGYIGTKVAYPEGGYETSPGASNVAPEVEEVLNQALRKLLVPAP